MTRTQQTIARQIRADIEAGSQVLLTVHSPQGLSHEDYWAAQNRITFATQRARYLAEHMQGIDVRAFGAACGVRLS